MTPWLNTAVRTPAVLLLLGCSSQVGDEYAGEPILSLQGNVVLSADQQSSDLVPQLAFSDDESVLLLHGEVSGDFPAKFRFDVMQPPPDEVIDTAVLEHQGIEGGIAHASLVMLPPDHPRRIPLHFDVRERSGECSADYSVCTHVESSCEYPDADATPPRCRERVLQCTEHACPLVNRWTLGSIPHSETAGYGSWSRCDAEGCYQVESACEAASGCVSEVYHCGPAAANAKVVGYGVGTMTTCTVLSESGDRSLVSYAELGTIVQNYHVIYVTVDVADPNRGLLAQGYNLLVQRPVSGAEWLDQVRCTLSKTAEAVVQYNMDHGTQHDTIGKDVVDDMFQTAATECGAYEFERVVARPLDEVINLELGAEPESL